MYNLGRASARGGPKVTFFHVHDPATVADMWSAIRQSYLDSWAAAGRDVQRVADWLDAHYAAQSAHRERQLETWNLLRMASEDPCVGSRAERRLQRQECRAMASEDRRCRLLDAQYAARRAREERQLEAWNTLRMAKEDPRVGLRAERRLQRRECRAMASEDRRRRLRRTPQQIAEEQDSRMLRRVSQWLRRLGQVLEKVERQAAAARAKESRREAQALAAAKRGRCQEEALERAAQRARREERWRWMNRRDITVGEMLQENSKNKNNEKKQQNEPNRK